MLPRYSQNYGSTVLDKKQNKTKQTADIKNFIKTM